MVRWEPGTRERLQEAALDLYVAHGFEQTTTAEIARSVGVGERTFFRHFADKREVLFDGQDLLEQLLVDAVRAAPPESDPLTAVTGALDASATFFVDERRTHSRLRQTVIDAHTALQERELLKLNHLGAALTAVLAERGVPAIPARLAAETGMVLFMAAFRAWLAVGEERSYPELVIQMATELRHVVGAPSTA